MVIIVNSYQALVIFFIILKTVYSDLPEGSLCEFGSYGSLGVCKLITHCRKVRDDVINNHILPQTCGFQETQPIVCCPKTPPGEISKTMCRRYSRHVFGNETPNITKNECEHTVKRAVGDVKASEKEFSHRVLLGFDNNDGNITWLCAGTLISELYVLTAATCINFIVGAVQYVKIGLESDPTRNEHKQLFKIAKNIIHPDFKYGKNIYHDIALIKLHRPAKLNAFARPACLYAKGEILEEKAIATGWGGKNTSGYQVLTVPVNVVDNKICNATHYKPDPSDWYYSYNPGIRKHTQICAGARKTDACQEYGDPLQIYHTGDDIMCMYDIVGVFSTGNSCGGIGVFTRVSFYLQWIENTVWPSEF